MKKLVLFAISALSIGSAAAAPNLLNGSFESNSVGSGYVYGPTASPWSFTGGAGISHSHTAWNGVASDGAYFAFLQNTSSLSQSFDSDVAEDYSFVFDFAARSGYPTGQIVQVALDGALLGSFTASNTAWTTYTVTALNIAAGTHTLEFTGFAKGSDQSAFIDNVRMTATAVMAPVPEPETYGMMMAGLGLLGVLGRRKQKQAS